LTIKDGEHDTMASPEIASNSTKDEGESLSFTDSIFEINPFEIKPASSNEGKTEFVN